MDGADCRHARRGREASWRTSRKNAAIKAQKRRAGKDRPGCKRHQEGLQPEHGDEDTVDKPDQAAEAAVHDRRPVRLEAMTALERKVVHEHLKTRHDVETYSEGEEPDRRLVVAPLVH